MNVAVNHWRVAAGLFVLLVAVAGCGQKTGHAEENPFTPPPGTSAAVRPAAADLPLIRVEPAENVALPETELTAPGSIEANPNRVAHVAVPVAGRISAVYVRIGDRVESGQPLFTVIGAEAEAAVSALRQNEAGVAQATATLFQANAALSQANAGLAQSNAALTQSIAGPAQANATLSKALSAERRAQANGERLADLFAHRAVAQKEVFNAEHELKQAQADVDAAKAGVVQTEAGIEQARAAVEQAKAAVEQAKGGVAQATAGVEHAEAARDESRQRLSLLDISSGVKPEIAVRAPFGGKVLEIGLAAGEYRNDTSAPVLTLADLRNVWMTAQVPETAIRAIAPGATVEISLEAFPGETLKGRIAYIADTLDPSTRTVKAAAELDNSSGRLRTGMFGRVRYTAGVRQTLALPGAAIVQDAGRSVVYVETSPGTFASREVVCGQHSGERVVILSGLERGERVAVDGVMLLRSAAH